MIDITINSSICPLSLVIQYELNVYYRYGERRGVNTAVAGSRRDRGLRLANKRKSNTGFNSILAFTSYR